MYYNNIEKHTIKYKLEWLNSIKTSSETEIADQPVSLNFFQPWIHVCTNNMYLTFQPNKAV